MEAHIIRYNKDGSTADVGTPFRVREPFLRPGDVLLVRSGFSTVGGKKYLPGDRLYLSHRTKEAPFDLACSLGNWVVAPPWQVEVTKEDIWSSIESIYTVGMVDVIRPSSRSVWDRLIED